MDSTTQELVRFNHLVELIYEGATAPERWTRDIMPAIADYLEAPAGILYSFLHTPQNGGYFFLHGIEQDHVDQYVQKYYADDVWKIAMAERNQYVTGNLVVGDELIPRAQLLQSNFYKACLSRNENMVQLLGSIVFGSESETSLPTICSFFRGSHHADFNETDRTRLRLLGPHLSRSLGVMHRLRSTELTLATSQAALDRLASGVLLLDAAGTVTFTNHAAQRMLADRDGLRLHRHSHQAGLGNLMAETVSASKAIGDAIAATLRIDPYATPHFSKSLTVPHLSSPARYVLQFSALGSHNEFGGSAFAAIVFITDDANKIAIDPAVLQQAYGLTLTEARVAVALLDHESAREVADTLGVSPNTIRTHIKNIYSKLGVDTRARFVKLLLGVAKQSV
ncbi:helix-turn-helix transcriptional regulator [Herbaspirillum sp.]|uniref:helix-turn-helix transcriptional regulator n=1 Tax=Herbaspirillum sp. TaxID=1890675 RepID=UPI0031D9D039